MLDGSVIELQGPFELDRDPGGFGCSRAQRPSPRSLETWNRSAEVTDQGALDCRAPDSVRESGRSVDSMNATGRGGAARIEGCRVITG
jgi:hypothetical protein